VVATDGGGDTPRTGRTRVHLSVADVDDQLPVFALPVYSFVVDENKPPGTGVGHVSAIDRDLDPFNKFTYAGIRYRNSTSGCATKAGSGKPPPFRLDPVTGAITTTESLDREQCAVYEVSIRAAVSPSLDSANTISEGHQDADGYQIDLSYLPGCANVHLNQILFFLRARQTASRSVHPILLKATMTATITISIHRIREVVPTCNVI